MQTKTEELKTEIVNLSPDNIGNYGVCGYKDVKKQVELRRKIDWYSKYYANGLRIKALIVNPGGYQGMIEYMPGEIAHRPVDANGYLFIQCVFVGFKSEFKGKGLATLLVNEVIREAREKNKKGVAVVTRAGSFMVNKNLFLKSGFVVTDKVKPDFELLALNFNDNKEIPVFKPSVNITHPEYKTGLVIMRSPQCPYTEKNVNAIIESGVKMGFEPKVVELNDARMIQESPCAFGSFSIIFNGEIIAHHPISNTRFENIMKSKLRT